MLPAIQQHSYMTYLAGVMSMTSREPVAEA
jgi:hypothetical protein